MFASTLQKKTNTIQAIDTQDSGTAGIYHSSVITKYHIIKLELNTNMKINTTGAFQLG